MAHEGALTIPSVIDDTIADCPQCGFLMKLVRGLKDAICNHCGYKETCCY